VFRQQALGWSNSSLPRCLRTVQDTQSQAVWHLQALGAQLLVRLGEGRDLRQVVQAAAAHAHHLGRGAPGLQAPSKHQCGSSVAL